MSALTVFGMWWLWLFVWCLQSVAICAFLIPARPPGQRRSWEGRIQAIQHLAPAKQQNQQEQENDLATTSNEDDDVFSSLEMMMLNNTATTTGALVQQALQSQVSYFYLQKELGLSEEIMWKITHDAPSALGMTASTIRSKVQVLKEAMDLSPQDIRDLLSRQPTLLHLSAQNNLKPKLEWIQTSLRMNPPKNKQQLRQLILAQPAILTYAPANLKNKLRFFTSKKGLGLSVGECRDLLLQEPKLWTASVKTGLLPRAKFFLQELEIPKDQLRLIVKKNPRVLLYSLEENLAPKLINYCIMTLHMDPTTHLIQLLTTYPQILDINAERRIYPITRYFLTELEFSAHEFRSILLKCPRLLTNSLTKIKHNVGYLRYGLQLDAAGVKRVLYQAPQVLGLDERTNLTPKIEFLKQQLLGTSTTTTARTTTSMAIEESKDDDDDEDYARQVIRRVILGLPTVLNLSVPNNLAPKLDYLRSMLQLEQQQQQQQQQQQENSSKQQLSSSSSVQELLCETVLKKPALLGYSLDKRIKPRLERIVNAGLPPSSITIGISMSQQNFDSWLHRRQKKKAQMAIVLWQQQQQQQSSTTAAISSTTKTFDTTTVDDDKKETTEDRSGRIVHWTRERKPL